VYHEPSTKHEMTRFFVNQINCIVAKFLTNPTEFVDEKDYENKHATTFWKILTF